MSRVVRIDSRAGQASAASLALEHLGPFFRKGDMAAWAERYTQMHALRCQQDAQNVKSMTAPQGTVLNVGGAPYLFEFFFQRLGDGRSTTIDLEPERFDDVISSLGIDVVKANVEVDDLGEVMGGRQFSGASVCEIFEHFRIDLLRTVRAVAERVRPGGFIYLTTPNGLSLLNLKRNGVERRTGPSLVNEWSKLQELGHMGHVREYSSTEVIEVLRHIGLEDIEVEFRDREVSQRLPTRGVRSVARALVPGLADELIVRARVA